MARGGASRAGPSRRGRRETNEARREGDRGEADLPSLWSKRPRGREGGFKPALGSLRLGLSPPPSTPPESFKPRQPRSDRAAPQQVPESQPDAGGGGWRGCLEARCPCRAAHPLPSEARDLPRRVAASSAAASPRASFSATALHSSQLQLPTRSRAPFGLPARGPNRRRPPLPRALPAQSAASILPLPPGVRSGATTSASLALPSLPFPSQAAILAI